MSSVACAPGADSDDDALSDACELALARAFAPELIVDARDCGWIGDSLRSRIGGGYLFVAQRVQGRVRIAFLPAYYRDCGWSGAMCVFRRPNCSSHVGDSELIVVEVAGDSSRSRWRVVGVFLSAHCSGRSGGRCRWFRDDELRSFHWTGASPRVWVSRGKHANYPTRNACDSGHWSADSCDGNRTVIRYPVLSTRQNAGSRAASLRSCLARDDLPLGPAGTSPGARECIWDESRAFRGWQDGAADKASSPYARHLDRFAGL